MLFNALAGTSLARQQAVDYQSLLKQIERTPRVNGYVSPKTETRFSSIQGLGLFATEIIPEGEVVAAWGGKVRKSEQIGS